MKHELAGSPYNDRRNSCERAAKAIGVEFLRDATMEQLEAVRGEISEEDYMRARYVIGETSRVLTVCEALEKFAAEYGHAPKIYPVVISDGARKLD